MVIVLFWLILFIRIEFIVVVIVVIVEVNIFIIILCLKVCFFGFVIFNWYNKIFSIVVRIMYLVKFIIVWLLVM